MVSSLHIPEEGVVGVRVGAGGGVSVVSYKTVTDGRIIFNKKGWKNFLESQDLHIGQAILLTGRTTSRRDLHMMFVIDIIIHNN